MADFLTLSFIAFIVIAIKKKWYKDLRNLFQNEKKDKREGTGDANIQAARKQRDKLIIEWANYHRVHTEPDIQLLNWVNDDTVNEIYLMAGGMKYRCKMLFADKRDIEYNGQDRVIGCESVIEGLNIKRYWDGVPAKVVPLSSIQKNIRNAFKTDLSLKELVESAHDECLKNGFGFIDLKNVKLDLRSKCAKIAFAQECQRSGNFSDVHLLSDAHTLKVFSDADADPI